MEKNLYGLTCGAQAASSQLMRGPDGLPSVLDGLPGPCLSLPANPRLAVTMAPESVGAEKFRVLAARLRYFQDQRNIKKLVVTSSIKGEGKSVISANLALTFARRQRTLLIDGDLRQSGLRDLIGGHHLPGLTDWWLEDGDISGFFKRVESMPLWYLPVGQGMVQPLELLQSQRMSQTMERIAAWFSWIVIDSPPLAPVADPNLWATHADGSLLVVKQGKTPKRLLRKALENTEDLKLMGVVVNGAEDSRHDHYQQYYRATPAKNQPSRAMARVERRLPHHGDSPLAGLTE